MHAAGVRSACDQTLVSHSCDQDRLLFVHVVSPAADSFPTMTKTSDEQLVKVDGTCDQQHSELLNNQQVNPHSLTKRITLRKPNLDSILGQGNAGVSPELISMRKQIFQRPAVPLPTVRSSTDSSKIYVRSNTIDSSSSSIKILNTGIKRCNKTSPVVLDKSRAGLVMRRTLSGDSVEQMTVRSDKENSRTSSNRGKTIITISQIEKERSSLQQQVSELVRNAETKKAEIASLKMEVNRLKETSLPSSHISDHPNKELETLRKENRTLRERLDEFERSGPMAIQIADENRKAEDVTAGQPLAAASGESSKACPDGLAPSTEHQSRDWDKTSSSSMSEISVACLQDRISQMEESHYSTNEELQATLQELQDLQDQVNILQIENESLETDKAVLYESLCSQTERLEESRSQVYKLKQILFSGPQDETAAGVTAGASASPSPAAGQNQEYLVELLRSSQQEYDELAAKKEELASTVSESKLKMAEIEKELENAVVSMKELENKIGNLSDEKKQTEVSLSETQKTMSALRIEISVMKAQLEKEQAKVAELVRDRDARGTSDLDVVLREVRQDKERIEVEAVKMQELLALTQLETSKLSEKVKAAEHELSVLKSGAEAKIKEMDERLLQETKEKARCLKQLEVLQSAAHDAEAKCQRHLEDKRELKATLSELQKQLNAEQSRTFCLLTELEDIRSRFNDRQTEWKAFQDDLLTTVRVANDFKTEAQETVEKIVLKNRKLQDQITELESENSKLKVCQIELQRMSSTPTSDSGPPVAVVPPVAPRRSVSVSPVCYSTPPRSPMRSISMEPVGSQLVKRDIPIARSSIAKWVDLRNTSQLSVKTLIDSIESASKHKASKSGPSTPSSSVTSPSTESPFNGSIVPEASEKSATESGAIQSASDGKESAAESCTPKQMSLTGNKYDGIRRNNLRLVSSFTFARSHWHLTHCFALSVSRR